MRTVKLLPGIFKSFPEVKTYFAVGRFGFDLNVPETVIEEREGLLKSLELEPSKLITARQEHGVVALDASGESVNFLKTETKEADGLFTGERGLFLGVRTADCLPILLYNRIGNITGIIHAGWRGTEKGVLFNTVRNLLELENHNCPKEEFCFYLGPAAQSCCYEGPHKNFVEENVKQLKALGIGESQIENCGICTIHNKDYPSHRREQEARQETLLSVIGIK